MNINPKKTAKSKTKDDIDHDQIEMNFPLNNPIEYQNEKIIHPVNPLRSTQKFRNSEISFPKPFSDYKSNQFGRKFSLDPNLTEKISRNPTKLNYKKPNINKAATIQIEIFSEEKEEKVKKRVKELNFEKLHQLKNKEFEENNDLYLESSTREMRKEEEKMTKYLNSLQERENILQHKQIIHILKEINRSELLNYEEYDDNKIHLRKINKNEMYCSDYKDFSVNEIMNSKYMNSEINSEYKELETKANKYNVKNKRITLGNTNQDEWNIKNTYFNLDQSNLKKEARKNKFNIEKKSFYNKYFLPVKFWSIEKKPQKQLLDSPLINNENFLYYNLHSNVDQNDNPFLPKKEHVYQSRVEISQEKLKKNTFASKFKKTLESRKIRVPIFLKDVPSQ